jgi:hypothetical protein
VTRAAYQTGAVPASSQRRGAEADGAYGARPTKRKRRTRDAIDALKATVLEVLAEIQPATVRQTFYQLVSRAAIEKTEQQYKAVGRLMVVMRRAGELPFHWLADNTRWQRKPDTYDGLSHLLQETARLYRRSVWTSQPAYVEVWLEKDALAGVLIDVTAEYDVPLMVTRGYPSVTFLHSAAEAITDVGKPTHLYYFGDYDPSGLDIPRKVEAGIRGFAPGADVTFTRVAVIEEQIGLLNLPTRPTKRTDSRAKGFEGESVEVDAIPPETLRAIVRGCIEQHIDAQALGVLQAAEESERDWLRNLARGCGLEQDAAAAPGGGE